jgi:hypothetical protein
VVRRTGISVPICVDVVGVVRSPNKFTIWYIILIEAMPTFISSMTFLKAYLSVLLLGVARLPWARRVLSTARDATTSVVAVATTSLATATTTAPVGDVRGRAKVVGAV